MASNNQGKLKKVFGGTKSFFGALGKKDWFISLSSSIFSIVLGLLIGLIVMLFVNPSMAFPGLGRLLTSGFRSGDTFANVLYNAAPIIMTGLSVAFAFKTGMFNIGGAGQFVCGGVAAIISAVVWKMPCAVSILIAMVFGALCGAIPGLLKAFFNVNEVLSAIMLNWISLIGAYLLCSNIPSVLDPGNSSTTVHIIRLINPNGILPSRGLDNLGGGLTISIFIAIFFAVIVYILMQKSTFGFELRATGNNKFCSRYAGISDKKAIISTFLISGALAGIGGALFYLSPTTTQGFELQYSTLPSEGFDGIAVALLGASNPIGAIFSGMFVSYLDVSGASLQSLHYAPEVVDLVTGFILFFASFASFFRIIIYRVYNEKGLIKGFICFKNSCVKWFHIIVNWIVKTFISFKTWLIKLFTSKSKSRAVEESQQNAVEKKEEDKK